MSKTAQSNDSIEPDEYPLELGKYRAKQVGEDGPYNIYETPANELIIRHKNYPTERTIWDSLVVCEEEQSDLYDYLSQYVNE